MFAPNSLSQSNVKQGEFSIEVLKAGFYFEELHGPIMGKAIGTISNLGELGDIHEGGLSQHPNR